MKLRVQLTLLALLRCGGADTERFTRAPWIVSESATITCDAVPTTGTFTETVSFGVVGSRLESHWWDWNDPCDFQWSLDGDTATLANGPVSCSNTSGTSPFGPFFTFTAFTVTMSSDGLRLTTHVVGTQTTLGATNKTCAVDITGTGTR